MKCHSGPEQSEGEESCPAPGRPPRKNQSQIPRFPRNDSAFQGKTVTMTIRPSRRPQGIERGAHRHFDQCLPTSRLGGCQESESHLTHTFLSRRPTLEEGEYHTVVSNHRLSPRQGGELRRAGLSKDAKIVGTNSTTPSESTEASKNELKTNSKLTKTNSRCVQKTPQWRELCPLGLDLRACRS